MYVRFTSGYGITFQRATEGGVNLEVYVDSVGVKVEDHDTREPDVHEPFRSLVGHLM